MAAQQVHRSVSLPVEMWRQIQAIHAEENKERPGISLSTSVRRVVRAGLDALEKKAKP